jgi:hypothetical protein
MHGARGALDPGVRLQEEVVLVRVAYRGVDHRARRHVAVAALAVPLRLLHVAVQVEFEKQNLKLYQAQGLKPGFIGFIGSRVETRRFQAMGQLVSTCAAPTSTNSCVLCRFCATTS